MDRILIVSDSRGAHLKPMVTPPPTHSLEFEIQSGATLNDAKNIVQHKLASSSYTCVYIMAGICSVTDKDEGIVHLPFDTKSELVSALTREARNILKELDDLSTTPIVLCSFPGVDLIRVNNKTATGRHPQQEMLNEAILEINEYIVDLNLTRGFSTPMLSAAIHRCHKKRSDGTKEYGHHYCRLGDGIHPTASTLKYWKKRLEEDFHQFIFNFDSD